MDLIACFWEISISSLRFVQFGWKNFFPQYLSEIERDGRDFFLWHTWMKTTLHILITVTRFREISYFLKTEVKKMEKIFFVRNRSRWAGMMYFSFVYNNRPSDVDSDWYWPRNRNFSHVFGRNFVFSKNHVFSSFWVKRLPRIWSLEPKEHPQKKARLTV
jgi:hypothetical protein